MHILVVDDKQAVRDSLIILLEASGYKVDSACNGLDAFEKAQKFNYDLFIIDHLMPIMNGLQLAKNLSQQSTTMLIPILFMTTQGIESINNIPESQLFTAILSKPINEENLLSQVIQLNIKNIQLHSL
ncbi:MAG: response regulator [Colwellia sp.]|nr:response regulator [Colwellia sp.]